MQGNTYNSAQMNLHGNHTLQNTETGTNNKNQNMDKNEIKYNIGIISQAPKNMRQAQKYN